MARWTSRIEGVAPHLQALFEPAVDGVTISEETFTEHRDAIVALLSAHALYDEDCQYGTDAQLWTDAVNEIKYATDVSDLDEQLHGLYDEADRLRIWIDPTK